jgi:hypothetical protein
MIILPKSSSEKQATKAQRLFTLKNILIVSVRGHRGRMAQNRPFQMLANK